jgi:DNA-binding winged helix-turn-helix (wHTH) protein/Tfp pilus assembly protein PilF
MNAEQASLGRGTAPALYAFDDFRLDARRLRLLRDGVEVTLTPKALAVLEQLVRRTGHVVTKQELLAAVWPNVVVEDGNLSQTIHLLRRALGEQPTDHRYIVTLPGRGYRFVADVRIVDDETPSTAVAAPGLPDSRELGVLAPADPGRAAPPRRWSSIAASLAVVLVLPVAVSAVVLGSQSHRGAPPETAAVHASAALPTIAAPAPAATNSALTRARFLYGRRQPGDLDRALAAYGDALAVDVRNADAWAGMAGVFLLRTYSGELEPAVGIEAARAAAERALEFDPTHAEAYMRLAGVRCRTGDRTGAQVAWAAAERYGRNVPLVLVATAQAAVERGDYASAVRAVRRAVEVAPLDVLLRENLEAYLTAAHRLEDAETEALEAYQLSPTDGTALDIGQLRLARGAVDGARQIFAALRDETAREQARALLAAKERQGSLKSLRQLEERIGERDPFVLAEIHALRGDPDRAFAWLEKAAPSDGSPGIEPGTRPRWTMQAAPLLASLHADPRWNAWERAGR